MSVIIRISSIVICLILTTGYGYAENHSNGAVDQGALPAEAAPIEKSVTNPAPRRSAPSPAQGTDGRRPQRKSPPRITRTNPAVPVAPAPVTPKDVKDFFSKPKEENFIILNFDNAELKDVINTVSSITNENFILTPGVDARITIHSAKKIPISEVMNVFESVLDVNGIALVKSGKFFKVVQGATAKQKPTEVKRVDNVDDIPDIDRPVTQIIPVKYVPVAEVVTVLTPLLSPVGSMTPNARNNLLIVNDLSSSIIRVMHILKEIDVDAFSNTRLHLFKPKYSDVLTLTTELTEVLNALNLTKEGIALVPIERINSLVVFSGSPTLLQTVIGWIKKLDEEVMSGQNIFVHPIQNVKAAEIADILGSLYETDVTSTRSATTQKSQVATTTQKAKAKRPTPSRRSTQSTESSRVEIITFEPTNSLIILAPPGVYRDMTELIKKIDVYPREVLIEAIIAEVDISTSDEYGIQWSVLHDVNSDYTGLVQNNALAGTPPVSLPSAEPTLDTARSGLSYFLFKPDKLTALVRAISTNSKVNILQSPRLLVRDQEEASIEVGSDIPTATSTTTSASINDALTQNIEYKTVGKKLKIKPSINDEKTVVLDIEQEVSDVLADARAVGGFSYPEFSTRKTKTSVVVPHKQGIVIGGIIEEKSTKTYEGIPILSRIPLLGNLFRHTRLNVTKTELIVIIVPHVITNRSEGDVVTAEYLGKLKDIKSFLSQKEDQANVPFPEVLNQNNSDE
ncbi:MAG: type II secretion system secretin GspD [Nitrospiraceae bacterium]|nr:MAG: type II secretion system secretin GspD [Nitrospiraceae bacterium]